MADQERVSALEEGDFPSFSGKSPSAPARANNSLASADGFPKNGRKSTPPPDKRARSEQLRRRRLDVPLWKPLSVALLVAFFPSSSPRCQRSNPAPEAKPLVAISSLPGAVPPPTAASAPRGGTPGTAFWAPATSPAIGSTPPPASLFDALSKRIAPVTATVEVHGYQQALESSEPDPFRAGGMEAISTAGTFGDISRFLQTFPGVVAGSDLSNEIMVRGGHPMENLFLVDGIEVPNINSLATLGTTGGFGPMIDAGIVQGIKLYTGGYEARFPERLSSVTEIRTLEAASAEHLEADIGIQGYGGLAEKLAHGGNLLVSAHHGIIDALGGSSGIGPMPAYTNEVARYRRDDASGNRLTVLQVAGWDSYRVTPCASDWVETSTIDSQYSGWRETAGAEWQRVYSTHSFAVAGASDSEQIEHIHQQDQILNPAVNAYAIDTACPIPAAEAVATPVYDEDSNGAFSTAGYRYEWSVSRFALSAGSAAWLQRPHYNIAQPIGAYSPYSTAAVRADSTSFASDFSTGETGSFAQLSARPLKPLELSAGFRLQSFAFGDHATLTPRLSVRYGIRESVGIHAAFAGYAQMPPYVYLLSDPGNRAMLPMRSTHEIVGIDLGFVPASQIRIEAYNKAYRNIPASTEYPSVNLHNLVDMVGQEFVWLPMTSGGRGSSSGIEVSEIARVGSRFTARGSVAYSRAMFAGLDGVMRPSNYDFPWIVNAVALERFGHGYELSARYGYATGRPYTPYDMPDSLAQNRPIYDVSAMNLLRAPHYGRLDAQLDKDMKVRGLHLELYAGANNLLDRANFLAYVWMPRIRLKSPSLSQVEEIDQMTLVPNFGVRYVFR